LAATVFGVIPWITVAFGCLLGYQLVKQNGRILLQLEALNERLNQLAAATAHPAPAEATGLTPGTQAPAFDLPGLEGGRVALQDFRGRRVLLTFFSPSCGFCQQMAPQLASLPTGNGHPIPVIVTSGDVGENRTLFQRHGIKAPVAIQESGEVGTAYQINGTPMGYLIDEAGAIASPLAKGAEALLLLAKQPGAPRQSHPAGNGHRGNKPLSESHLNRNGLAPGTAAPDFTLPGLGDGELSLADYRGKPVLLVFSDPDCGPCMQLAPQLEDLSRQRQDLQVLVISRGDMEANRAKARQLQLTYPIVLQRHWEISKDYGMFGTPIGYLIDGRGIIAAPPASGADGILALATSAAQVR
jgi:peroxiredoxin